MKGSCMISGQSGFIGRALTQRLKLYGSTVIGIPRSFLIERPPELMQLFKKVNPDYIFHLAAYGNHYNQQETEETVIANVFGAMNMLKCAQEIDYNTFFNFSSSSVSLKKQTVYSACKMLTEVISEKFRDVKNIRPYSVYGPGEASNRFIPTVIMALHTGEQITVDESACHDWIFIDDFITALMKGETEIGTGEKVSNIRIVRKLEEISGKKLNYTPGVLRPYDNSSWVCPKGVEHISLKKGLQLTYEYYSK